MTKEPSTHRNHYIWIPDTNVYIAREQSFNGLDHDETSRESGKKRYFMPSSLLFMRFYKALIAAEEETQKITLYNGVKKPLTKHDVRELYKRFVLGKHDGVWTHLDAYFIQGLGFKRLDIRTDHRVHHKGTSRIFTYQESPLEECVYEHTFVDISFNRQGFPTKESNYAEWQPGKNIGFRPPQENCVAMFGAGSCSASLNCSEDPKYSNSELGVLTCFEGTLRRRS